MPLLAVRLSTEDLQRLEAEYPSRRAGAEAAIVRWVEADRHSTLHRPEPLHAEREREGAVLFAPRRRRADEYWRYGIDAQGRVVHAVLESAHGPLEEHFVSYQPGSIELVQYQFARPDSPVELARGPRRDDGALMAWESRGTNWSAREEYAWGDAGQLREIHVVHESDAGPATLTFTTHYVPEYGADGRLEALLEQEASEPSSRIAFPQDAEAERRAFIGAISRLEAALVVRLEAFVRRAGQESFCLALQYEPGAPLHGMLPVLGPREHASRARDDAWKLWNPAEWPEFVELSARGADAIDADDIREPITQITRSDALDLDERAELSVAMLNRVAARLTHALRDQDAGPLPRFIVFATDVTTADMRANLLTAIDTPTTDMLAAAGLLPP